MKTSIAIILFPLMLNNTVAFSQDIYMNKEGIKMNKEVEKIVQLGKDSIVQLALKLINKKVGVENFTRIKVMTNGKDIFVSFRNPIKYLPKKTAFYFDIGVSLFEKTISLNSISNPEGYNKKNILFYTDTEETKMNISFVIQAINTSNNVDSIDVENFEDDMIIRENKNYYSITVSSEFYNSWYKMEKFSGKLYDQGHDHSIPDEIDNEDTFKEINFIAPND
jgi:hypothetical protein